MKFLLTLLAATVLCSPARAADMPTKAAKNPFAGYVAGACGMYGGINSMGTAETAAIFNPALSRCESILNLADALFSKGATK